MITVRLSESQHLDLKVALAREGNTIQQMVSDQVDRYIAESAGTAPPWTPPPHYSDDKEDPGPADAVAGCRDHPGAPKPWCLDCQRKLHQGVRTEGGERK